MGELTVSNLFESQSILADHKDLIHDVAYDFYGERVATCSSDQYVKVWDSDGRGGWRLTGSWKAHHGSVWKVTWAHPEFGQVIATCSFDRTAAIWEEVGDIAASGSEKGLRTWVKRSNLVDSRTSVTDVKFGPKHLGLLLVTCSADGIIRIKTIVMRAGHIPVNNFFKVMRVIESADCSACNTAEDLLHFVLECDRNKANRDMYMAGLELRNGGINVILSNPISTQAVQIYRIYEAPDVMNLAQWTLQHEIPTKVSISCLSWNPSLSRINPPMLAVGSDEPTTSSATVSVQNDKGTLCNGKVFIYEYTEAARRWTRTDCLSSVCEPVNDIAFAPNLGRSFHLLAVATKDVRIIKIEPLPETNAATTNGTTCSGGRFKTEVMAAFEEHYSCVWRVSWNVTGTLLASSGDDCCVRLWKMQYLNQWKCVAVFKNESVADDPPPLGRAHTAYVRMAAMANPTLMPYH